MIQNILIFSISILSICFTQENRLFWDGREWNSVRAKVNFIDEIEYKIKSTYIPWSAGWKALWIFKDMVGKSNACE